MQPVPVSALPACPIREMQRDDVPAVSALAARVWRAHYAPNIVTAEQIEYMIPRSCSEASILKNIAEKSQRYFIALDDDRFFGYIAVEPRAENTLFIDKLYVENTRQRKGIGSALLRSVTLLFKPASLTLRVNRKNIHAVNFYFRHGFVIYALDVLDIGNGYVMDDFLMKKNL